jgi:hypothetical protein
MSKKSYKLNITKKYLVTKQGERKNLNNLGKKIKRDYTYNGK